MLGTNSTNRRTSLNERRNDYTLAKKTIQKYSDVLEEAELGMAEDWFWTAEQVYSDGVFKIDLDEEGLSIAGIASSSWATPALHLTFKDGSEVWLDCYEGDVDVLSEECQRHVDISREIFLPNNHNMEQKLQ